MIDSVLLVCEGNICRSPMAAGWLQSKVPSLEVWSAGISALAGQPADPYAQGVMKDHGIDISSHRGAQLSGFDCKRAELILVMQEQQKRYLEKRYPFVKGRVFRLGQFSNFEVPDPYRKERNVFEDCFDLIERGLSDWVGRIESTRWKL
ncbi:MULTISPECIES: low molecular weight protein-tyrosine-phosphatase [unclassified Caballeronia]|uniref:low molecular weight protein-tyrosine-phosphatase n=2 Tax=Caballeronia TaxID=1827195 RepID=UPI0028618AD1|nr:MULTISPECIES: low molecular weight protein-tyrosine-phosphatase [unclassified Caballeronia]MDR5771934.1 low molecular weight phosphotyrosine protein phosphatase [Caballeronia sp. LZ002]MDR5847368.1 low molecular weight phosphotyrosine protein phosphatase [Caballeronia sp. LZ003]